MSSAQEFLQRVERTGIVSEPLLEELRKRVAETHKKMKPELLAKILVDRGELTAAQARKLVAQQSSADTAASDSTSTSSPPPLPPKTPSNSQDSDGELQLVDDDELSLAESDELELADSGNDTFNQRDDELELAEEDTGPPEAILIDEPEIDLLEPDSLPAAPGYAAEPTTSSRQPPEPPSIDPPDDAGSLGDLLSDPVMRADTQGTRLSKRRRGISGVFQELFGPKRPRKNRWDSPLILVGGAALILLMAAGAGFFALFYSESADDLYQAADDAYSQQSYGQAIENFERFHQRFASDDRASLARVRVELSKLRQQTEGTKNWEDALAFAGSSLPTVKSEESFGEVRPELSKLLPDITQGLVDKSSSAATPDEKQRLIDLASQSMDLVNNPEYLPTSVRKTQEIRIEEIQINMDIVRRDIERDRALIACVAEITAAAENSKITEAYQLRDALVTRYPVLARNVTLRDALAAVSKKEREAVSVGGGGERQPQTADHPKRTQTTIVLSDERGSEVQGVNGQVIAALVRNAVYGLRATDGKVLWRRFVGYESHIFPQAVSPSAGSDFILVDAHRSEVIRLDAKTGKLVWRLPCPSPIATPRVFGESIFVCCGRDGSSELIAVNATTGEITATAKFPVGCTGTPAVYGGRNELIQVGTHTSVYVLDAKTLACTSVVPVGHTRESIAVGPAVVGNSIVIAENNGHNAARLHVFNAGAEGGWSHAGNSIKLAGQVVSAPVVDDQRVLISTDNGSIHVFEAPSDATALREVASLPGTAASSAEKTFALLDRSDVWLVGKGFNRLELQATRGQLLSKNIQDRDDRFIGPPQRIGSRLFHVRRRKGMLGATVSATEVSRGAEDGSAIWQTDVGVASNAVINSAGTVHAVTANGAIFPIDSNAARAGVTSNSTARINPQLLAAAFSQQVDTSPDTAIFASPPPTDQMAIANLSSGSLQLVPLRIDPDLATTELVEFQGSLLAACKTGPIHLLDPTNGRRKTSPFLPRLEPGSEIDWLLPAALDSKQFIAGEKQGRLYRVVVGGAAMKAIKNHSAQAEFIAGLAAVGKAAYAVMNNGGQHTVVAIDTQELSLGAETPLKDGLAWGPKRVGNQIIVADGSGTAHGFNGSGNLAWSTDKPVGPLAGTPLLMGGNLIFASGQGLISVVNSNGNVIASEDIAEPIGGGPINLKGRLLVSGWDGTLHVVNVPK